MSGLPENCFRVNRRKNAAGQADAEPRLVIGNLPEKKESDIVIKYFESGADFNRNLHLPAAVGTKAHWRFGLESAIAAAWFGGFCGGSAFGAKLRRADRGAAV